MQLTKAFELLDRQVVAREVQQPVEQHRAVPIGEHEAVAVGPGRIAGMMLEVTRPQGNGDLGHAHRHAGMARFGRLHGIHGERAQGIRHVAQQRGIGFRRFSGGRSWHVRFHDGVGSEGAHGSVALREGGEDTRGWHELSVKRERGERVHCDPRGHHAAAATTLA